MPEVKLLAARIDALVIGYQVEVSSCMNDEIDERQSFSDLARVAELRLGDFRFQMARNRSIDRFTFENQDCRCLYDRRGPSGWNLEVVLRATFLATHTLPECLHLSQHTAGLLGEVQACRLRRVDPAADYLGFELNRRDADCLVTQRAKLDTFLTDRKDIDRLGVVGDMSEHLDARHRVTGISVAKGNPISARFYDKVGELALPGREQKREIEEQLWRRRGYRDGDAVARVEFQIRGEALDSFGLRDPNDLHTSLDRCWQYCAKWVRLIQPTRKRMSECPLDPRWVAVQETVFYHPSEPAIRSRVRGGATAPQALGVAISRQAATGALPSIPRGNEAEFIRAMTSGEAARWLFNALLAIFEGQARDCFNHMRDTEGVVDAAIRLAIKLNAAHGKYSSVDDHLANGDDSTEPNRLASSTGSDSEESPTKGEGSLDSSKEPLPQCR